MYNLVLYSYGAVEDSLIPLPLDQAISNPFTTKFDPDNYYQISVTAENCAGGSGSVNSETFVLLGQLMFYVLLAIIIGDFTGFFCFRNTD